MSAKMHDIDQKWTVNIFTYISNKYRSYKLSIYQVILKKTITISTKILSMQLFSTRNISWASKQYIRMISKE